MSRNTFRTKIWLPAVERADLGFHVRMHDLRHAHASWLLAAGGADLKTVMDRMGRSRIQTTQNLHSLRDADDTAIAAFQRTRQRHTSR